MKRSTTLTRPLTLAGAALSLLAGCATQSGHEGQTGSEPVAHEYRTGSILAQREKRPTTEAEKQRAQEIAAEIRSAPQTILARP